QLDPGGHGSGFDWVGAFQAGYVEGRERCVGLLDNPLPLVPNEFVNEDELAIAGDSAFGYREGEIGAFLPRDLNDYWLQTLLAEGARLGELTLVPVPDGAAATCAEPAGDIAVGAVFYPASNEIIFDESFGLELYTRFGDFAVGYILGAAWSEAVQLALESPLTGEPRALVSDCLTGAWVADIIPVDGVLPPRGVYISPGDLDEAIRTVLVIGDAGLVDDVVGSGFEKIASFRQGVLDGIPACLARLDD
ncbi:MAG: hypothetical protein ACR2HP_11895, partial [Ilumatobacteraceae bacterium]